MTDNQLNQPIIKKPDNPSEFSVPKFGRIPAIDHRDRNFLMSTPPTTRTFRNWLSLGPAWDQGQTSQCVSYATNRFLVAHKIVNKPPMSFSDFYHECQKLDEWEGEDYDGTSVRAAFKLLKNLGYCTSYGWATTVDEIVNHILEIGPVVVGTDWTQGMSNPDQAGYIWPTGRFAGGHAYLLLGVNTKRINPGNTFGAVRMINSWSPNWGEKGRAWISFDTLQKLLDGLSNWPGEACTAIEIKKQ